MSASARLAERAGVSYKPRHFDDILSSSKGVGFFEVHAENYMGAGGPPHARLERLRRDHELSVHGVGLSIGGSGPLDDAHLARLKTVVERYKPALVSEHLAWSSHRAQHLNDLLAVPYTDETLRTIVDHIDRIQIELGRQILLENPSTYVRFEDDTWDEVDFIADVAKRSGCGLLLDVNNVFVSCTNHGWDAQDYIARFPLDRVGEVHLAGHAVETDNSGRPLLIDTHDRAVADPVMALFQSVLARTGPVPTLIEWDAELPTWAELAAEAARATVSLQRTRGGERHVA